MPLTEGQVLEGKYVITRRIAEGGMGEVYEGVHTRIGKRVAIKVLRPEAAANDVLVARFEFEAQVAARIASAHVADVYDFGEQATGERFMVIEYLEGETLSERLERVRTLPRKALASIALQVLDALSAAHAAGVVHRDLKPENIFLTKRDKHDFVKIVDFGISKLMANAKADDPWTVTTGGGRLRAPTQDGAMLGTPMYMSPEQARGLTPLIDHRTDIYSLGVILYEAASGELPFVGENLQQLLFRIALDDAPPLVSRMPEVDPALSVIVGKAMHRTIEERYASADEMREAVLAWRAMFSSGGTDALPPVTVKRAVLPSDLALDAASVIAEPSNASVANDGSPAGDLGGSPRAARAEMVAHVEASLAKRSDLERLAVLPPARLDAEDTSLAAALTTLERAPAGERRSSKRRRAAWMTASVAMATVLGIAVPGVRHRAFDRFPAMPVALSEVRSDAARHVLDAHGAMRTEPAVSTPVGASAASSAAPFVSVAVQTRVAPPAPPVRGPADERSAGTRSADTVLAPREGESVIEHRPRGAVSATTPSKLPAQVRDGARDGKKTGVSVTSTVTLADAGPRSVDAGVPTSMPSNETVPVESSGEPSSPAADAPVPETAGAGPISSSEAPKELSTTE